MFGAYKHTVGSSEVEVNQYSEQGYARHVLTAWGYRTVELTGPCDTFFSQPARLQVSHAGNRYSVKGFVTTRSLPDGSAADCLQFYAYDADVKRLPVELHKELPPEPCTVCNATGRSVLIPDGRECICCLGTGHVLMSDERRAMLDARAETRA